MPLNRYLYHGQAYGADGQITEPGPYPIDGHAKCEMRGYRAGNASGSHDKFEIPNLMAHEGCEASVKALPEENNFFRTEIRSTVTNLNVENGVLKIGKISMGMVAVYGRHWWDSGDVHAKRTRVLPMDCSLQDFVVNGKAAEYTLPAPFTYSADQRESYLYGDTPDSKVDDDIRNAITTAPARCLYVKNFGRIFYGEWTLLPSQNWQHIHQVAMVRLLLGSPQVGGSGNGGGQTGGEGGGTG